MSVAHGRPARKGRTRPAWLARAEARIRAFIAGSAVPEDPAHADNTVEWLLRLRPGADAALHLAALGHDIDRAAPDKVRREDFDDYDAFKAAHAEHGAAILGGLLARCGVPAAVRDEACRLVRAHEVGGDPRADLLKDADSLSYFEVNLPLYYRREGRNETLRRCVWGIRRLSPRARRMLEHGRFIDSRLVDLVQEALRLAGPSHAPSPAGGRR